MTSASVPLASRVRFIALHDGCDIEAAWLDVAEIAASYGGGGHKNAAGFQMPIGWEGDSPVPPMKTARSG